MLSDLTPTTDVPANPLSLPLLCILQPLRLKFYDEEADEDEEADKEEEESDQSE